jgi:hypothetical protein
MCMCTRIRMAGAMSSSTAGQLRRQMGRASSSRWSHQRAAAVGTAAAAAAVPRPVGATCPSRGPKAALTAAQSTCWRADWEQRVGHSPRIGLRARRRRPIERRHRRRMLANSLCCAAGGGSAAGSAEIDCEAVMIGVAGCRHKPEGGACQATGSHVVQRPPQHLHPTRVRAGGQEQELFVSL